MSPSGDVEELVECILQKKLGNQEDISEFQNVVKQILQYLDSSGIYLIWQGKGHRTNMSNGRWALKLTLLMHDRSVMICMSLIFSA